MKDYRKFEYTNENYLIFRTIEAFSRTASGIFDTRRNIWRG